VSHKQKLGIGELFILFLVRVPCAEEAIIETGSMPPRRSGRSQSSVRRGPAVRRQYMSCTFKAGDHRSLEGNHVTAMDTFRRTALSNFGSSSNKGPRRIPPRASETGPLCLGRKVPHIGAKVKGERPSPRCVRRGGSAAGNPRGEATQRTTRGEGSVGRAVASRPPEP
jgi:hypothetical protein